MQKWWFGKRTHVQTLSKYTFKCVAQQQQYLWLPTNKQPPPRKVPCYCGIRNRDKQKTKQCNQIYTVAPTTRTLMNRNNIHMYVRTNERTYNQPHTIENIVLFKCLSSFCCNIKCRGHIRFDIVLVLPQNMQL